MPATATDLMVLNLQWDLEDAVDRAFDNAMLRHRVRCGFLELRHKVTAATGQEIRFDGGFRSLEEQDKLYERWKLYGGTWTVPGQSKHEEGRALDVY